MYLYELKKCLRSMICHFNNANYTFLNSAWKEQKYFKQNKVERLYSAMKFKNVSEDLSLSK